MRQKTRKPGLDYQEIVVGVQRALDPGSVVTVGEWIEGPDGRRELDVSVGGTKNGKPFFTLIECNGIYRCQCSVELYRTICSPAAVISALSVATCARPGPSSLRGPNQGGCYPENPFGREVGTTGASGDCTAYWNAAEDRRA